jgi:mannose-6-phosphate isomerase-like protein (cupin superfamily)
MRLAEKLRRFAVEAELYTGLMRPEKGEVRVAVRLTDTGETATLVLGEKIEVAEGSEGTDLALTMEAHVFEAVSRGEADFGALIGRSRMSDVRPINYQVLNPSRLADIVEVMKAGMTFFFTPGRVKVRELRPELAGEAHGAHPIPIAYWDGLRAAWYVIRKGEVMNEEGERDPYPQAVVVLKGKGVFILDEAELELRPSTVVYMPPNSMHQIRAEEDVEAIWIAWKTPP